MSKNSIKQKRYRERSKLAFDMYLDLIQLLASTNDMDLVAIDISSSPSYTIKQLREQKTKRSKK